MYKPNFGCASGLFRSIKGCVWMVQSMVFMVGTAWAKQCEIPLRNIQVAGLQLGQQVTAFQKQHPTAVREKIADYFII